MPSFDVVSVIDLQEVRNAVDQASREVHTRFDFKGTESVVELQDGAIRLESSTEDRLAALVIVLEEKLVRRKVSLKSLDWGTVEAASRGRSRQIAGLRAGIDSERSRTINKMVKDLGLKGIQTQTQGDQVRVTGKKRDSLQEVIAAL
ncbi:MAG TPA: YajQ family cyclic di-GMP-binding protein, partial [Acidimicrobiia bacterium]|nr:YajQ family cyclic di-GMP-binding protein [Acidimicrobiia bacterium]